MALSRLPRWQRPVAVVAALFGLLTLLSGGLALFGGEAARQMAGNAVPVVLWFNFLAGAAYVIAALALWTGHLSARPLAWAIALASLGVFGLFWLAVVRGDPFEARTIGAMTLRCGFWLAIALALGRRQVPSG